MASHHRRNIDPMLDSLRCGARTRCGKPCRAPAVAGARRCRMHGGKRSGAPAGNRNALKHGLYAKVSLARDREARQFIRTALDLLEVMEGKPQA